MPVTFALAEENILSIDGSFLLIFVSIIVLIFVLNNTLFKPIIKILEERDRLGVGRIKEAKHMIDEYEKRLADYEAQIRAARASAFADLESRRRELMNERTNQLNRVREEIKASVDAAKNEIAVESDKARLNLEGDARSMAVVISSRLLHRPVSPASNEGART
jgi:F-type H+-transporting ATPase subunit b